MLIFFSAIISKEYNAAEMISNLYRYKVPNQPKSSAADVYAVIIKDLTDAERC
jgi:hypothetical protein